MKYAKKITKDLMLSMRNKLNNSIRLLTYKVKVMICCVVEELLDCIAKGAAIFIAQCDT